METHIVHTSPDLKASKLSAIYASNFELNVLSNIIEAGDSKQLRANLSEGSISDINMISFIKIKGNKYNLLLTAANRLR